MLSRTYRDFKVCYRDVGPEIYSDHSEVKLGENKNSPKFPCAIMIHI